MPRIGLWANCLHRKDVRSERGSVFIMCLRGLTDPSYPKYPGLPVLICAGFEKHTAS